MGDVDDIEDAERDRHADGHGSVESAEQDAGDHCVDQQIEAQAHLSPLPTALSQRCSTRAFNGRLPTRWWPGFVWVTTSKLRKARHGAPPAPTSLRSLRKLDCVPGMTNRQLAPRYCHLARQP